MLSVFPIMFLAPFAYAILRVFAGGVLLYLGLVHRGRSKAALYEVMRFHWPRLGGLFALKIMVLELILGLTLIAGVLTQVAALIGALMALKFIIMRRKLVPPVFPQTLVYVLLLGTCLSLVITGAGPFAVDLPI